MRGVLYVSHGSRVPDAVNEATDFIDLVKAQVNVPLQETCFLELTSPNLAQGFQSLVDKGATEISVVPVLLLSAGHYYKDIPAEIEHSQQRYPNVHVSYGRPLGVQPRLTEILKQRIEESGVTPNSDAKVLIIGRGSYNPQTHIDISTIKTQLYEQIEIEDIETCYLAACKPAFKDALHSAVQTECSQIYIVPYLWFTGILDQQIIDTVTEYQNDKEIILCKRLGKHQHLQDALKARVEETFEYVTQ
ncbi:sirohydrochlorin chelatase [Staphylococcus saprophyticus]|uniref:sirohydrochlorin chelatase n=1 Tax=Staphylococcus saprophyticus TaxID=29385 RepID=UPI0030C0FC7A